MENIILYCLILVILICYSDVKKNLDEIYNDIITIVLETMLIIIKIIKKIFKHE